MHHKRLGFLPFRLWFQRSPRPKPGCIRVRHPEDLDLVVSTLTPAEAGVHRRRARPRPTDPTGFNAHPGRSRGASRASPFPLRTLFLFQRSPRPKPGCIKIEDKAKAINLLFQRSPRPKPGCIPSGRSARHTSCPVSTLTPAEAGVHRGRITTRSGPWMFQRSPRPKPGCITRAAGMSRDVLISFNAHPGRSRGASPVRRSRRMRDR